jgi:ArsR family transcriptional regulator, virulence genes transcriptional regulator
MNVRELETACGSATALLKAMSNPRRLMILCYLLDGERAAGELERLVGLRQSAMSQHLAKLRKEGLVRTRREGQSIFYALAAEEPREVLEVLYRLFCNPRRKRASAR